MVRALTRGGSPRRRYTGVYMYPYLGVWISRAFVRNKVKGLCHALNVLLRNTLGTAERLWAGQVHRT